MLWYPSGWFFFCVIPAPSCAQQKLLPSVIALRSSRKSTQRLWPVLLTRSLLTWLGLYLNHLIFFIFWYIWVWHMDLCNESCSSGQPTNRLVCPAGKLPSCFVWQKVWRWTLCPNFLSKFFCTHCGYKHQWLLPFYNSFSDLDLGWGWQGQHKAKPVVFYVFQLNGMKLNVVMKQFRLDMLRQFEMRFV